MLTPFFEGGNSSPLARKERERNDTIARALERLIAFLDSNHTQQEFNDFVINLDIKNKARDLRCYISDQQRLCMESVTSISQQIGIDPLCVPTAQNEADINNKIYEIERELKKYQLYKKFIEERKKFIKMQSIYDHFRFAHLYYLFHS
jgi:hypothetical protein